MKISHVMPQIPQPRFGVRKIRQNETKNPEKTIAVTASGKDANILSNVSGKSAQHLSLNNGQMVQTSPVQDFAFWNALRPWHELHEAINN